MQGARSIVVNITGGPDLSLAETSEATGFITRVADPEANVIYGIVTNETLRNAVRVTVIATGFDGEGKNGNGAAPVVEQPVQPVVAADTTATNGNGDKRRVGLVRRMFGGRGKKE